MPKSSRTKVATKDDFQQHFETLCNAVFLNNFETHTLENPYLNPMFITINCMNDKDTMRVIATDRLAKLKAEERAMTKDIREYLKSASPSEVNFIRSLDGRVQDDDEREFDGNTIFYSIRIYIFILFFLFRHEKRIDHPYCIDNC